MLIQYRDDDETIPLQKAQFETLYERVSDSHGEFNLDRLPPDAEPYATVLPLHPRFEVDDRVGTLTESDQSTGSPLVEAQSGSEDPTETELEEPDLDVYADALLLIDTLERHDIALLEEENYYFQKERAKCDDSFSRQAQRLERKRDKRRTHFYHAVSKDIVAECAARNVGTIAAGDLTGIREDVDCRDHGNLDLHGWAFDSFREVLKYKAAEHAINVEPVDEHDTSKSCGSCEITDNSQRVQRRLYVCDECRLIAI